MDWESFPTSNLIELSLFVRQPPSGTSGRHTEEEQAPGEPREPQRCLRRGRITWSTWIEGLLKISPHASFTGEPENYFSITGSFEGHAI